MHTFFRTSMVLIVALALIFVFSSNVAAQDSIGVQLTASSGVVQPVYGNGEMENKNDVINVVAGSGLPYGKDDADLILEHLVACDGDTVELVGHFRVDKSIKVSGMKSCHIKGEGIGKTILEAVRDEENDELGFGMIPVPPVGGAHLGLLLWLDAPVGNITIEDLTLQVLIPSPVNPHPNPFIGAEQSTALNNLLVITSPNSELQRPEFAIRDVAMHGLNSDAEGNHNGQNLVYCGIVAPIWTGPVDTTVEDSSFAHCGEAAYESWSYLGGTSVFSDNSVSDSTMGVWISQNQGDVSTTIRDNAFIDVDMPVFFATPPYGEVIVEDNECKEDSISVPCL